MNSSRRSWRRAARSVVLAGAVCASVAGCSFFSKPPPPPPPPPALPPSVIQLPAPPPVVQPAPPVQVAIALEASARVNPDPSGRASPVVVRVYELKSAVAFEAADFFALLEREQQAIGPELVGRDEYQLKPGERLLFARPLRPGTRVIAATAAFRDMERATWKAVLPIPTAPPQGVSILLDGRQIRIVAN
jgi:type VI secretion system protein VasD